MKRLSTVIRKMTKKASDTSIIEAYKRLFVDYIHSKHFPTLNKDYLEDLCWDEEGQEIAENLEVGEEEYTNSEHSMYYEKIYGYYEVEPDEEELGLPDTEAVAVEDVLEYLGYDIDDEVDKDILEDEVCEYLSDEYGYLIKSYNASVDGDYIAVTNIEWEIDEEEEYLEGQVHIDYSLNYTKNEDGSCLIYLDVFPEMKTEDYGTFVVQEGFTIYGTNEDFETMASEAQQVKQSIDTSDIEVF